MAPELLPRPIRDRGPIPAGIFGGAVYDGAVEVSQPARDIVALLSPSLQNVPRVVIEGPPIYLGQEHPNLPTDCQWSGAAFEQGWQLTNHIAHQILTHDPKKPVFHHALIDDVNFAPEEGFGLAAVRRLAELRRARGGLLNCHSVRRREGEFQLNEGDGCALMDARFQMGKLTAHGGHQALQIMVHPLSFFEQQQAMLGRMLGLMKLDGALSRLPKTHRRSLLESGYRHVWVGANGEVTSVTRPVFDSYKFVHDPIQ
ncbi:hypothetical protein KBB12_02780 [Candidatus Woesebacteria bacterium]|nr:hypothetical protein [Candidatus Woesebacteria bacterium]